MRTKIQRLSVFATTAGLFFFAASAHAETLEATLSAARLYNPQVHAASFGSAAASARVDQAKAAFMPTLTATGSYGINRYDASGVAPISNMHPLSGGVSMNLPLYTGGRLTAQLAQARAENAAADQQEVLTEQSVLLSAANQYLKVARAQSQLKLAQGQADLLQQEHVQAQKELEAGIRTRTDVAQTLARLSSATASVQDAKATLETANFQYQSVVGRMPDGQLEIPPLDAPANRASYMDSVQAASPTVRLAQENVAASQAGRQVARSAYAPTLSLQAGLNHDQQSNPFLPRETNRTIGLQLTIPLYTGGMANAVKSEAQAKYSQALADAEQARAALEAQAASAWAELGSKNAEVAARQEQVDAAMTALEGARKELKAGTRTVLDVLNAEQELLDARTSLLNATFDRAAAVVDLRALAGTLGQDS